MLGDMKTVMNDLGVRHLGFGRRKESRAHVHDHGFDFLALIADLMPETNRGGPAADINLDHEGSVIVVIATDAPLSSRQLEPLASRAALGLARTGSTSGNTSGDICIAFSTANTVPQSTTSRTVSAWHMDARSLICRIAVLNLRIKNPTTIPTCTTSNTMSVVRTVRLATGPRASMPAAGGTGLMGAARPQTPRRSPRQAFGGTQDQHQKVANKRNQNIKEPAERQL